MEFKCTKCNYPDEDNRLQLIVKDGVTHKFYISKDGSLFHYDSDGNGQEIYLECQLCGQKYDFDNNSLELHEEFTLKAVKSIYPYYRNIDLNDLKFKARDS